MLTWSLRYRNYASLLLGGVIILSITFWFTYGKRSGYSGVVIETDAQPINDDRSSIDDAKTAVKGETLDLHIGEGSGSAA